VDHVGADKVLANATPYLQAFGHWVLAWTWLEVVLADQSDDASALHESAPVCGRLSAMRYFFAYELPKLGAWLDVVERREDVCASMQDAWF
jgi:butyryl-CoA dehydrogenase